ncbi:hypothetical protein C9I92_08415 [Photobacterium ganghwense]|uniref:Uncharacterized protein n=1 Tax=Photobacterium ganghwense TaxID=320778 RepID=A0A0J1K879_9GAMM|nr:hypothetical protein ABT57_08470 [Photobacterium ganghwense]PSU09545.1 hypothetical protein C9I92_08415 [Photobacterium ganghwense]
MFRPVYPMSQADSPETMLRSLHHLRQRAGIGQLLFPCEEFSIVCDQAAILLRMLEQTEDHAEDRPPVCKTAFAEVFNAIVGCQEQLETLLLLRDEIDKTIARLPS